MSGPRHIALTDRALPEGMALAEDFGPVSAEVAPQAFRSVARIVQEVEEALRRAARLHDATHVVSVRITLRSRLLSTGARAEGRAVRLVPAGA